MARIFAALIGALAAIVAASRLASASDLPPGFARLADVAPQIEQDMRYAGPRNFTSAPVPGYKAPQCWLRTEAAKALAQAQADAHTHGFDLVVYDCYRPRRAVAAFVDWSRNADQTTKRNYYPNVEKRTLFAQGYIAERSMHSTGLAVDLGVKGWDFATSFDFFDKRSWTKAHVPAKAHERRETLVALMKRHGFTNYPREWWHFAFQGAEGAASYDAEVE
jgi:D-alanyl-D-alanine dipeptidase